ncbi:methionine aminopeptidase [Candidatus Acidianus copahuensis]|uniref:Methionine aminopeptidase n=1 Tax=Candidatus Acidianus copahuensis TaxID=1160895 RepID=A0A031LMQ9_9CREN|nr:type II methionyl aminopeptidase [Candidatus Acidianus copahuensis]EZQ03180.1 methionine aminopeptidase [Candidatus Acidianus copahuensis]
MSEDELKVLINAGKIAAEARDYGSKLIKPGVKVLDVCEAVEKIIIDRGAFPAFPCNLSINYEAAHYSPKINDDKVIPEGAVVKLDIGAHIGGIITDTAVTVSLDDKYNKLLDATRDALRAAISNFKPGNSLGEIGKLIERAIKINGYTPIRNLGGHLIRKYELHAGIFVPNVYQHNAGKILLDNTFAIEPFATDGYGEVVEGKEETIYSLRSPSAKGLNETEKKFLDTINSRFKALPFSERWLSDLGDKEVVENSLKALTRKKCLYSYPVLLEVRKGIVAQFEHTVYVGKEETIVIT